MLHNIKAKLRKKIELFTLFLELHAIGLNKCKSIEHYISVCRNFAVQLSYSTAAKVSRIFIYLIIVKLSVYSFKLTVCYNAFTTQIQFSVKLDFFREIFKISCIMRYILADFSVSPCYRSFENPVIIRQHNSQSVKLPAYYSFSIAKPFGKLFRAFGFVQRQYRTVMLYLLQ